jgi:very-short-patch-repair endonuclease
MRWIYGWGDRGGHSGGISLLSIAFVMTELYNRTRDKAKRRRLRQSMPTAERIVWARLRNRQLADCKFRRQYGVAQFVVDFYAPELKLAIEIDGPTHWLPGVPEYDAARQAFIESTGATFLRFGNWQVYNRLDSVLAAIELEVDRLRQNL